MTTSSNEVPVAGDAELSVGEIRASDVLEAAAARSATSDDRNDDDDATWRFAASYSALYSEEQLAANAAGDDSDDDDDDDDDDDHRLHSWSAETLDVYRRTVAHESSGRMEASVRAALSILSGGGTCRFDDDDDNNESDIGALRHGDGGETDDGEYDDGEYDDGEHREDWGVDYGADGKPFYFDIVHEAMEARWSPADQHADATHSDVEDKEDGTDNAMAGGDEGNAVENQNDREEQDEDDDARHDSSSGRDAEFALGHDEYDERSGEVEDDDDDGDRQDDSEEEEEEEDSQNGEDRATGENLLLEESRGSESGQVQQQQQQQEHFQRSNFTLSNFSTLTDGGEDEWQEAYTAKGRVYYYNRRTRESSWKKPDSFVSRQPQKQLAFSSSFSSSRGVDNNNYHNTSSFYSSSASLSRANSTTLLHPENQNFLFCAFCGTKTVGSAATMAHFRECRSHRFHQENRTDLHRQFEELLCLMSEDATLRSLHYASSYPDAKPVEISPIALKAYKEQASASETSSRHHSPATVQDSLFLLHRHRKAARTDVINEAREETHKRDHRGERDGERLTVVPSTAQRALERMSSTASARSTESASSRWRRTSAGSASDATSSHSRSSHASRQRHNSVGSGGLYQELETCRYCNRSFAEGRLAKHEAVCPRVFGTEGSWGRGVPQQQPTTPRTSTSPFLKAGRAATAATFGAKKSKSTPLEKRNLVLSFKEHQATLVSCPNCQRKFAPSGAQQHIDICKSVQNRPKNPIRAMNFAMAG